MARRPLQTHRAISHSHRKRTTHFSVQHPQYIPANPRQSKTRFRRQSLHLRCPGIRVDHIKHGLARFMRPCPFHSVLLTTIQSKLTIEAGQGRLGIPILSIMVRVLPLPGTAITAAMPSLKLAASCCLGFNSLMLPDPPFQGCEPC